jgi:hypothetical protein
MLRHPVAAIAKPLGMLRDPQGVAKGESGVASFDDRREIED